MHAKYFVVDGEEAFVGSQNFDWRALEHIHEMGAHVRVPAFGRALAAVFLEDWDIAETLGTPQPVGSAPWVSMAAEPRFPERKAEIAPGSLVAPMPGKVVKVMVAAGDTVAAGATLLILEAMKMEQPVKAAVAGTVTSLAVSAGEQVEADQLLAVVSAS